MSWATARGTNDELPPVAKGTTKRKGLLDQGVWAQAHGLAMVAQANPQPCCRVSRLERFSLVALAKWWDLDLCGGRRNASPRDPVAFQGLGHKARGFHLFDKLRQGQASGFSPA